MLRRSFLGAAAAGAASWAQPRKRPNIVLIMADDMGYSDLGCYGGEVETPNLDRLAQGGVRFTHFQNAARCCPTRASLLTGLYSHQAGVGAMVADWGYPGYRGELNRNCVTIAEALKPAGYRSALCGKYHVTRPDDSSKPNWPRQRGFDYFFGTVTGAGSYFDPTKLIRNNDVIVPDGPFYYTDAISRKASAFIESQGKGSLQPFFLYTAYTAPHWPIHALEQDVRKYEERYKAGWDRLRAQRWERMLKLGVAERKWGLSPRDPQVPAWDEVDHKDWQARRMAVYAAMIDRMDQGIGRILQSLDAIGERDNTLILFLADNGGCHEILGPNSAMQYAVKTRDGRDIRRGNDPNIMPGGDTTFQSYGLEWAHLSNTPFRRYKHWTHEGGISTPLIAYWPNGVARPGRIDHQHGHVIDLMATALDVAGVEYPKTHNGHAIAPLEGKSLKPIFDGARRPPHRAVFWEHEGNKAVRMGDYKLVAAAREPWELYKITEDRCELNNLAAAQPERARAMQDEWNRWAARANVLDYEVARKGKPPA